MIRNLIFDFGNVLVHYDYEIFFRWLVPDVERRARLMALVNSKDSIRLMERGCSPLSEIMEDFIRQCPDLEKEIRLTYEHKPECVMYEEPGMRELLTRLKAEGFALYGLSNWDTQVYATIAQYHDIFKLLDGWVISTEVHFVKPEPEIYNCLFEKFGLNPGECFFADDKAENIEAAGRLGMDGVVFTDAAAYELALRRALV